MGHRRVAEDAVVMLSFALLLGIGVDWLAMYLNSVSSCYGDFCLAGGQRVRCAGEWATVT